MTLNNGNPNVALVFSFTVSFFFFSTVNKRTKVFLNFQNRFFPVIPSTHDLTKFVKEDKITDQLNETIGNDYCTCDIILIYIYN